MVSGYSSSWQTDQFENNLEITPGLTHGSCVWELTPHMLDGPARWSCYYHSADWPIPSPIVIQQNGNLVSREMLIEFN